MRKAFDTKTILIVTLATLGLLVGGAALWRFSPLGTSSSAVILASRSPAPDFNVTTTTNTEFRLSDQRGKVVVLFFTAPG